jgi:branched-subunit amino acid aminotransferase/4-amino-4-deoxychorismate lyase
MSCSHAVLCSAYLSCCAVQCLFVDDEGHVLESPDMSLVVVTTDNVMLVAPMSQTLPSITLVRLRQLIPEV